MSRFLSRLFLTALLVLWAAAAVAAGTLTGLVRNGTTGAPAPGQEVILIRLQGGMEPVATTKSDAQGRYRFERAEIGQQPMLVRVNYRGVNYHQNVPPARDTANIEIFEPSADPSVLRVASHLIVVQPNGSLLLVGEEYSVYNRSKPPAAFYKAEGTFSFEVPEGGELTQVAAWGPAGMPVVQGTIEKGKNRYAIAFAFRPGENGVRVSYQLPYGTHQATLHNSSPYAADRLLVLAPPTLQVQGAGFSPAGTEQGWNVLARDAVKAGELVELSVAGTAPPPAATETAESPAPGGGPPGPGVSGTVRVLPGRLDDLKWVLIGGFAALFALGAVFLWRKPRSKTLATAGAEMNRAVRHRLDEIKETLFRLELRKQAGTISEEEYAHKRNRAEKVLRDLVKR